MMGGDNMDYSNLQQLKKSLIAESKESTPERKKEILIRLMEISLQQCLIKLEEKFPRS